MPKVRHGQKAKSKQAKVAVTGANVAAIIAAVQSAGSVKALRGAMTDLAILVGNLAEAVGLGSGDEL